MYPLSLQLGVPRLRPNVLMCDSSAVQLLAILSYEAEVTSNYRTQVDIPSVTDLSTLLQGKRMADKNHCAVHNFKNLIIEVMGCHNNMTFPVGKVTMAIPASVSNPELVNRPMVSKQFRVSLTDAAGVRTGMLAGSFSVRPQVVSLPAFANILSSAQRVDQLRSGGDVNGSSNDHEDSRDIAEEELTAVAQSGCKSNANKVRPQVSAQEHLFVGLARCVLLIHLLQRLVAPARHLYHHVGTCWQILTRQRRHEPSSCLMLHVNYIAAAQ